MTCTMARKRFEDISLWDGLIYLLKYLGKNNKRLEIDFYNNVLPEEALTKAYTKNRSGDIGNVLEDLSRVN
ncbi:hypothetical protein B6V88_11810 [Legionella micdadei]|nr:hypothetical protein B6V88_11810 [Legionella micdadei]